MNREQAKALLPIITAFAEGKEIEHFDAGKWHGGYDGLNFSLDPDKYRIRPPYIERHEASGLKVGDRVKVVRAAKSHEDGWGAGWRCDMDKQVGNTLSIIYDSKSSNGFCLDDRYYYPYFVLEKVEPKYRPFANAEEFKPHRDKWLVNNGCYLRASSFNDHGVSAASCSYNWNTLVNRWTFDDGSPCGVLVTE